MVILQIGYVPWVPFAWCPETTEMSKRSDGYVNVGNDFDAVEDSAMDGGEENSFRCKRLTLRCPELCNV